jgi:hypothetical protein
MDTGLPIQPENTTSSEAGTMLSPQQFYRHDPLLVLLKDKLRLNDFSLIACVAGLPALVFLSWWFCMQYVVISKVQFWEPRDTLSSLVQTFIIFPLLFGIYALVPTSIADLFNTLQANGVIGERRKALRGPMSYEQFLQKLVTWIDSGWWVSGSLAIVVLYFFYRVFLIEVPLPTAVPLAVRISTVITFLPLMYATCISVIRLLLALVFTNWLFYLFTIQVKPLHPDGSGGLGVLGRILWVSIAIMLWDALLLSTGFISSNMSLFSPLEILLLIAIYIALTPSLLIGWLVLPHWVMVKARTEALLPLAHEFQQAILQTKPSAGDDSSKLVAGTRRLSALKQRYELLRSTFPTWPVEIEQLGRLVTAVSLPVLISLFLPYLGALFIYIGHLFSR